MSDDRDKRHIVISVSMLCYMAYIYMAVPVVIFFIGWLRPVFAILFTVLFAVGLFFLKKSVYADHSVVSGPGTSHDEKISMPLWYLLVLLVVVFVWVYLSGIGGFVWQRADWHARNALMHDLLDNKWPVIFDSGEGLVYYLCFWMVPASVGKLAGIMVGSEAAWTAANIALYVWSVIGVMIVCMLLYAYASVHLCSDVRSPGIYRIPELNVAQALIILLLLIFWGGMDVIGQIIVTIKSHEPWSFYGAYSWSHYQYTPFTALLEWVFNQAIPAWIAALLFMFARKKESAKEYVVLVLLLIPIAPFVAVGLMLLCIPDIIAYRGKGLLSIPNICMILSVLPVFALYYGGNSAVMGDAEISGIGLYIPKDEFGLYDIIVLLIFWTLEFLLIAFLICGRYKHDRLFITDIILLILIPFFRIGPGRDFLMRGSVIPVFVFVLYVMKSLFDRDFRSKEKPCLGRYGIRFIALCICLLIGAYSAVTDFCQTINNTLDPDRTNVADAVGSMSNKDLEWWNDYTADTTYLATDAEGKLFYRYLAKRKIR